MDAMTGVLQRPSPGMGARLYQSLREATLNRIGTLAPTEARKLCAKNAKTTSKGQSYPPNQLRTRLTAARQWAAKLQKSDKQY